MSSSSIDEVVQRVSRLESEMERAHAVIRGLQQREQGLRRSGAAYKALSLAGVIACAVGAAATTTRAQVSGHSVTAPFDVVDAAGGLIMHVGADSFRGVELFASGRSPGNRDQPAVMISSSGVISLQNTKHAGVTVEAREDKGPRLFVYSDAFETTHFDATDKHVVIGAGSKGFMELKQDAAGGGAEVLVRDGSAAPLLDIKKGTTALTGNLEVRNGSGKTLVDVGAGSNGHGRVVARNSANGNGSGLQYDSDGNPMLTLKSVANTIFTGITKNGAIFTGPLDIVDDDAKSIVHVQSETVSKDKDGTLIHDKDGKQIMVPRGLYVSNAAGNTVSQVYTDSYGNGRVKVIGKGGAIGKPSAAAALMILDDWGYLGLTDAQGNVGADLHSQLGLQIYNSKKTMVARVSRDLDNDGGQVVIGDSSGAPVVKAKVSSEGLGMVGTGPFFGGPIGNMGVPFMIIGKKGR